MNATIKNSADINELAKWIDENLEVELSINIEEKSWIFKWYLQRLFKHIIGISIGRYINKCSRRTTFYY